MKLTADQITAPGTYTVVSRPEIAPQTPAQRHLGAVAEFRATRSFSSAVNLVFAEHDLQDASGPVLTAPAGTHLCPCCTGTGRSASGNTCLFCEASGLVADPPAPLDVAGELAAHTAAACDLLR